jgi:predicted kinase
MSFPIIIISGHPGTGKSYLAAKLSEALSVPLVSKDGIKESLFDTLGWSDREWSKKLSVASIALLFQTLEAHLNSGTPLIVESNFKPQFDNEIFAAYGEKHAVRWVQVLCWAEGDVLVERFQQRSNSGERHPGHCDSGNLDEFRDLLQTGKADLLAIPGDVIEVDTTTFATVDYAAIIEQVRQAMHGE